jgi:hypothetical protein
MAATADMRPVDDLPVEVGKTTARELPLTGIISLRQAAERSKKDLPIHGVGPKAIATLGGALVAEGLDYKGG